MLNKFNTKVLLLPEKFYTECEIKLDWRSINHFVNPESGLCRFFQKKLFFF